MSHPGLSLFLPKRFSTDTLVQLSLYYSICFIGTLIYASVIYHRHRRQIPYHRSHQETLDNETERYKGPFSDPTISTANYSLNPPSHTSNSDKRDSSTAPEVGTAGKIVSEGGGRDGRWGGELDHENEIREMNATGGEWEGEGFLKGDREGGEKRELGEGERWAVELSATRSVKNYPRVELDA